MSPSNVSSKCLIKIYLKKMSDVLFVFSGLYFPALSALSVLSVLAVLSVLSVLSEISVLSAHSVSL